MIVLFLIIPLLAYETAAKSNGPSNNLQDCTQPYRFEKSMAMGNKAWIASNNLETGQDIVCSHMTTSDGLRMCACVCQTNMKGMSKSNNDIKWTVPKYKKCSNPEDAKDNRLYCYDLATTDDNRKCSCTCSTVKAGFPFVAQEDGMVFSQLDEDKDFSKDDSIGHKDNLIPNIILEESEEALSNLANILNNTKNTADIPSIHMYSYITNPSKVSNESVLPKDSMKTTSDKSMPTRLTPVYIPDSLTPSGLISKGHAHESEATKTLAEEVSLDKKFNDSMPESPKIENEGPYVVYVTTEQGPEITTEHPGDIYKLQDGLKDKLEVKYNENNESKKQAAEIKDDEIIMLVDPVEDSKKSLSIQNETIMSQLVMKTDDQEINLPGPLTTNVTSEVNIAHDSSDVTKQPRLILLSDAIKHQQNGIRLSLDSVDSLNSSPAKKTTLDDNIMVIYPNNNLFDTTTDVGIMKQKPQQTHVNSSATKSDEKVVYVYSQPVIESSQIMDSSAINRKKHKEQNMSRNDEWQIVSKKSSVTSSIGSKLKPIESSSNTLLSVEKTEGSPIVISVFPALNNSSMEVVKPKKNIIDGIIQNSEPNNEVSSSFEHYMEQMKESLSDTEDYIEDESVTIAYSGKVFQSVPAEGSPNSESVYSSQINRYTMPSAFVPAYKSETTLGDHSSSPIPGIEMPSSTVAAAMSSSAADITSSLPVQTSTIPSRSVAIAQSSSLPLELTSTSAGSVLPKILTSTPLPLSRSSPANEAAPTESLAIASITSTPKDIKTTTDSSLEHMGVTMKLSLQEEIKLKRQNQFMEFLRKKSQGLHKHRLTVTPPKRPSTTHVPLTDIRKMLLDAAQRRNALLKGRDKAKTQHGEVENTSSMTSHEKIEDIQQSDEAIISSSTTTPRIINARRGASIQRRPLHARTTMSSAEVEQ